ncbi:alpha/beta hydrolase [Streptomyces sp. WAC06614]|uniref:alpha/beta hydrolase n=1 Tax=Streptomyces sp. WAC06614 TaxID=2487416 RepID=UPI000F78098A|nr:alpha/beta hydrolase [Streptomyces sp. WAC06614]RSS68320.1 alpha/beta hydrolase [Streptomyces sp. WAC06614]
MLTSPRPTTASPAHRPGKFRRTRRGVLALFGSVVAFLTATIMLGAYFPSIPKAGVIGPVLGGQYPFHVALLALAGVLLGAVTWHSGLLRWGRLLTAVTALSTVAALAIGCIQFTAAQKAGTTVSFAEVFTQLANPDATPDTTQVYATRDGQALGADLYLPERGRNTKVPAIILAHAGGFHTFDKSDLRGTGRWLADHGVATVAVDYSLAAPGRSTWNTAPQDLLSALRWVEDHADTYGIDPSRISMGGMSAGGTLAMNTAYRLHNGTIHATEGPTPKPPASVVGFYPGTDVTQMWEEDVAGTRNAAELFTGGTPAQYPQRYREVSPTTDIRKGLPPTLLVVGDRDRSARPETIKSFAASLHAVGSWRPRSRNSPSQSTPLTTPMAA